MTVCTCVCVCLTAPRQPPWTIKKALQKAGKEKYLQYFDAKGLTMLSC